jgi:AbrB family looped-hinge helix DNA binding protein
MKKRPIVITKNNMITLPKWLREKLDLQPGDCLDYEAMANGSIILARKECCDTPVIHPACQVKKRNKMR